MVNSASRLTCCGRHEDGMRAGLEWVWVGSGEVGEEEVWLWVWGGVGVLRAAGSEEARPPPAPRAGKQMPGRVHLPPSG